MQRIIGWMTVAAVLAACAAEQPGSGGQGVDTAAVAEPACQSLPTPVGLAPMQDVAAAVRYAQQLTYLEGPPYGERRPLTVVRTPGPPPSRRFGLSVDTEIQPEACSHLNDPSTMQNGAGRIVARIITSGPYPKLGLPRDTSYLWIHNLVITGETGLAEGVVIPGNGGSPEARRVRLDYHPGIANRAWPEARLLFTPEDDQLWESCVRFGCCYLEEGKPGTDTTRTLGGQ